jgi:hypothetical protein
MCPFGEASLLPFSSDENKHHATKSLHRLNRARDEKEAAQVIGQFQLLAFDFVC